MTTELFYLILTALFTGCLWVPHVIGLVKARGMLKPEDYKVAPTSPLPHWVQRANRAHLNAVESLAPFAVMVLCAHLLKVSTGITATCAMVFFYARVIHAVVHIGGFSLLMARTLVFAVGFTAFVAFAIEILRLAV